MDELYFLPLGGCAEIGMNLNAYAWGPPESRQWLIVDVGVTFGDALTPGVDLIMADPEYLVGEEILGIVLTHAHEDHIGAVAHLWRTLKAPIHASRFTAQLVARKLAEEGLKREARLNIFESGDELKIGPFSVTSLPLTHSIPEMSALVIRTAAGTVFHTGDWKIDSGPVVGETVNEAELRRLGAEGVLAMVCDSTNVFVDGEAGSEDSVRETLIRLVGGLRGRVAVAGFASNVARLTSVCEAARRARRQVALVGRSMQRVAEAARAVGLLAGSEFLTPEAAASVEPDRILYLCTGSQGEPRAALSRIARGDHPSVRLGEGDTVIFSSRVIPGNEKTIGAVQNALAARGVRLITESQEHVHVSGHPCRDELARMYDWVRPGVAIPVHGERRHCLEHVRLARSLQVAKALAPENGQMVRLAPGEAEIVEEVPSGRLLLDGIVLTPAGSAGIAERRRISRDGHIVVALAVDEQGVIAGGPELSLRGYSEADGSPALAALDPLYEAADRAANRLGVEELLDDDAIDRGLRRAIVRAAEREFGKRPMVDVMTVRVG